MSTSLHDDHQANGIISSSDDAYNNIQWLNAPYVEKIILNYERNSSIDLLSYEIKSATSKGENFASALYRLNANYKTKNEDDRPNRIQQISLIVKSRLQNELMAAIETEFNIFERESQWYTEIQQKCEQLLRDIGDETLFGPRCYYSDEQIIVLEDLKRKGYAIQDVKEGLDFEHSKILLEKLAKLHAASRILYDKDPELFRHHMKSNMPTKHTPLEDLFVNSYATCLEFVKSQTELLKYAENFEIYGNGLLDKMFKIFQRNYFSDEFHILNHGDVWVNNVMFKTDELGNILDVLMVDYQEGSFGSPGIDLNYFIYTSLKENVYVNKKEELLEHYHQILSETLEKLKFSGKIPTLQDVNEEIRNKIDHGITTAICLKAIFLNEHQELADPEIFLKDNEESKKGRAMVFNNPKYGEYLKIVLQDFVKNGYL